MPHLIGTAGHIDHGKTALVRALTGIDTDRLKEEKERGISIDLGFAWLDLPDGTRAAIVDVPGHERFIRNMLAGAHAIDLALLVVAADDGVMPQTEEHLDILHLLGVRRGIIAMTKCDLADAARTAEVREEIGILTLGTGLEMAPIVPVSVVSGTGIEVLRGEIARQLGLLPQRVSGAYFRLPVDRVFTRHGHGTIVTGTAISGSIHRGDSVLLQPSASEMRVRAVHVHGVEVESAGAGQRVALNLVGEQRRPLRRGEMACDPRLELTTRRADVSLELRPSGRISLRDNQTVRVHSGTVETIGRVVLFGPTRTLEAGSGGFGQLVLREPLALARGDRFVLRRENAQQTIAGGTVLHPFARRRRRADGETAVAIARLHQANGAAELIRAVLALEPPVAVALDFLAQATGLEPTRIVAAGLADPNLRLLPDSDQPRALADSRRWEALAGALLGRLAQAHAERPTEPGVEMESLRSQLAPELPPQLFHVLITALENDARLHRRESLVFLPGHRPGLQAGQESLAARIEGALEEGGLTPPDLRELEVRLAVPARQLTPVLQQLERDRRVFRIAEGIWYAAGPLVRVREDLREYLQTAGTITAAQLRDRQGISRKFSIALLDYFDRIGFTLRVGDVRKLGARKQR